MKRAIMSALEFERAMQGMQRAFGSPLMLENCRCAFVPVPDRRKATSEQRFRFLQQAVQLSYAFGSDLNAALQTMRLLVRSPKGES